MKILLILIPLSVMGNFDEEREVDSIYGDSPTQAFEVEEKDERRNSRHLPKITRDEEFYGDEEDEGDVDGAISYDEFVSPSQKSNQIGFGGLLSSTSAGGKSEAGFGLRLDMQLASRTAGIDFRTWSLVPQKDVNRYTYYQLKPFVHFYKSEASITSFFGPYVGVAGSYNTVKAPLEEDSFSTVGAHVLAGLSSQIRDDMRMFVEAEYGFVRKSSGFSALIGGIYAF